MGKMTKRLVSDAKKQKNTANVAKKSGVSVWTVRRARKRRGVTRDVTSTRVRSLVKDLVRRAKKTPRLKVCGCRRSRLVSAPDIANNWKWKTQAVPSKRTLVRILAEIPKADRLYVRGVWQDPDSGKETYSQQDRGWQTRRGY